MGLPARCLPLPTTYDPAEDPPGSTDPLGTLGAAERIAEVLFPGFKGHRDPGELLAALGRGPQEAELALRKEVA